MLIELTDDKGRKILLNIFHIVKVDFDTRGGVVLLAGKNGGVFRVKETREDFAKFNSAVFTKGVGDE